MLLKGKHAFAQVRERGADGFVVQADVLDPKQITQRRVVDES
jgi:hypothetical protein